MLFLVVFHCVLHFVNKAVLRLILSKTRANKKEAIYETDEFKEYVDMTKLFKINYLFEKFDIVYDSMKLTFYEYKIQKVTLSSKIPSHIQSNVLLVFL